jgi:hypothetical protein
MPLKTAVASVKVASKIPIRLNMRYLLLEEETRKNHILFKVR